MTMSIGPETEKRDSPHNPSTIFKTGGHLDLPNEPNHPRRRLVTERYQEELKLREANPDKIFYDGVNLRELDPNLITLNPESKENPRSWSRKMKWTTTALMGAYCFLPPFASTIFAPALLLVMADLGIKNPTLGAIQVSIFVLAFALGPIFAAPLSEIYGRTIIVRTCNILFITFSLGSGFAQNAAQLTVCRFFAGVGGSGGLAVFGGVLADIWDLKERAKASALMSTLLILGPVAGPACGGWISERESWRWTCWVPAMAATALEVISLVYMKESYFPVLLERKLLRNKRLYPDRDLYTVIELRPNTLSAHRVGWFVSSAIRPVIYLLVDPALFLLSLYFAFVFGEVYLLIVTFPEIFGEGYGHSAGFVGIDLLAQGVGNMLGLIVTVKAHEIIYERQTHPSKHYDPESRLVPAFPGALLIGAGLFLYGFSALKYHFIVPLVGFVIFAAGAMNIFLAIQLYIVDCFSFPASAVASLSFLRFVFAGVFPLFGSRLFQTLGVDWGTGLLAFLSLGLGVPFLPLIYIYGKKLREIGKSNMQKLASH
ncbi:hypothetical protein, variant 1 [Blastomyces dermatitidis ER-3]|uniref:Membrane transporter n=4 Tax=Ajellomyces dermatitidis TaxID=5039 RepID=F2TP73_AJEDA|nr:uncharacterized protein BDCG_01910 [Blastomyces dermatitidis ER-3]XP_045279837.1 hypothetical protein, variant 1 [Blastomyces dermatitidis ER-3]EGE85036.2 membrane transporter [Blastomyces dermatitidis ATCC 18188]OAT00109.1 hypothetical protein BDCG_01910 [Blastomyces dermatitidis ER-3]OAT00110.1 hypothetical protein, variant 1 [Blastomyces dermatitidis ER-3]